MHERQTKIYLFQMTRYHPCGTPYRNKVFSLNTDLQINSTIPHVWNREIFAVKHCTRRNRQNVSFDESERR